MPETQTSMIAQQEATRGCWHRYERSDRSLRTGLLAVRNEVRYYGPSLQHDLSPFHTDHRWCGSEVSPGFFGSEVRRLVLRAFTEERLGTPMLGGVRTRPRKTPVFLRRTRRVSAVLVGGLFLHGTKTKGWSN